MTLIQEIDDLIKQATESVLRECRDQILKSHNDPESFKSYCKEKFVVNNEGEVKVCRSGKFNGNGLYTSVSWDDLQDLWNAAKMCSTK